MTDERLDRIEKLIKYDSENCCRECGQYDNVDAEGGTDAQGLGEELIAEVRRLRQHLTAILHTEPHCDSDAHYNDAQCAHCEAVAALGYCYRCGTAGETCGCGERRDEQR